MIGTLNQSKKQVTIVGGGIAGLLLAERLSREFWQVDLFEASDRLGGLIATQKTPEGLVESAAHSLLASSAVREHFRRLGVPLMRVDPSSRARWILWRGQLRRFPMGPFAALGVLIRAYFKVAPKRASDFNWTMEDWGRFHLGDRALARLIAPMITGIYGCTPRELLVSAAFPSLWVPPGHSLVSFLVAKHLTRRNRYAHLRRSKDPERGMAAPEGGMQTWIDALSRVLNERPHVKVHLNHPVSEVADCSNLVLCVPPTQAAKILQKDFQKSAQALSEVRSSSLAAVTVFPERSKFQNHEPKGVGYLVPREENRQVLGVLFHSSAFPDRSTRSETCVMTAMVGGTLVPEALKESDAELLSRVRGELARTIGYQGQAVGGVVRRWPHAVPIYGPELVRAWSVLWSDFSMDSGRIAFANWTGQVSLRGMIEFVESLKVEPARPQ